MAFFGVCYSPYHWSSSRTTTKDRVAEDLAKISKHFSHIRTYSSEDDQQWTVGLAAGQGLKVALGVWINKNAPKEANQSYIYRALVQAAAAERLNNGTTLALVIGNEVDRPDVHNYQPQEISEYINFAKSCRQKFPEIGNVPVTTCFSGTVLHDHPEWTQVVDNCDQVVYLTVYPWYGDAVPDNIAPQMEWSWNNGLRQVADRGKRIVIAEIGWPSAGGRMASVLNEQVNFNVTKKFLSSENDPKWNLDSFWFEMFDEPWKTAEGSQGPHWGLVTSGDSGAEKFPI